MAKNMTLWAINFIREATKLAGIRRLPGTRGISYAAAVVAEADEGLLSSEGSDDVVEYNTGYGERGVDHEFDLEATKKDTRNIEECEWVPHPRSGIYFPKGHDWVLQDVPHSPASTSGPAFWLRNIDGVDVDGPHIHNF